MGQYLKISHYFSWFGTTQRKLFLKRFWQMAASALFLLYEKQCEEKSLGKNHEKSPRLVYPWNNYSNLEFSSYVTSFWNVLCIYTYFSSFLKTMLTDDSVSPEFNKISHWFLLCTFETSWQIAASAQWNFWNFWQNNDENW